MTKIKFVQHDGTEHVVNATIGQTVMEAARNNGVAGIVADCGGACACATCHVYVRSDWFERTGKPDEIENDMLECAEEVRPTSRLSCQIRVSDMLDGLTVEIPFEQQLL